MRKRQQFLIVSLAFAGCIIINQLIQDYLYELSISLAIWMQGNTSELFKSTMFLITYLGEEGGIFFIIVWLWIISPNKIQVLKIVSMVSICGYIIGITKMLYKQSRPYYINQSITSNSCPLDFGNPSGHSLVCTVFYVLVFETMIFKKFTMNRDDTLTFINRNNQDLRAKFQKPKEDQEYYSQLYPSAFLSLNQSKIVLYTFICLIGLSRIFLGAHSLNQILLGYIGGAYIIFLYKFKLEQFMEESFLLAIYKKFDNRLHFIKCNGIVLVIYFLLTVYALIVYLYRRYDSDLQAEEIEWLKEIKLKCPQFIEETLMFENKMLRDTGLIYFPLDVFLCLSHSKGTYFPSTYPETLRFSIQILRSFVLAIICAIPIIILGILIIVTSMKQYVSFQYIFQCHVGIALIAIALIIVAPFVYKNMKLDVPGDLMRVHQGQLDGQLTKQELEVEL